MIKVFVNNVPVLVPPNTSALEACDAIGVTVPRFCYHERLNVAGNCRMCLVEIEKAPKPIASCAFPVAPNMRIYTDTPMVQKARENVLEFLLMNHPLDCPICDQGGECDLQEQTMAFGSDRSRYFYSKRGVEDKNCGPLVKTIMTRCIHCTRCVRFFQDVAGQEDFGTTLRGQDTEIGTYVGKNLTSELSGNIIDLCPVGALTSKPYAFTARPWETKSVETIDILDAVGSNIKINFKETEILRVLPALNDSLNEEWISDKTRFSFDGLKVQRIGQPFSRKDSVSFSKIKWQKALNIFLESFETVLRKNPENALFVCGNNLDLETLLLLKKVGQSLGVSVISENFLNTNQDLMSLSKSNTTFADLLDADLCLTVGTNVRFEASLLNVRLKKRARQGNFVKASIGLTENSTYQNDSIGTSIKTVLEIAEGKHMFCQKLTKAKNPVIILGSGVRSRLDSESITSLVQKLSKYCNVISDDWLGLGFIPLTSNVVGKSLIGMSSATNLSLKNKTFVYCVGLDSYENLLSRIDQNTSFIVTQTPFSNASLKKANLILPSTTFTEKQGTFVNLEGRIQSTTSALVGPSLAKNDFEIVKVLLAPYLSVNVTYSFIDESLSIADNKRSFIKALVGVSKNNKKKVFKTPFKAVLSNFFSSNAITKNSIIMSKCASVFKKNYFNFI